MCVFQSVESCDKVRNVTNASNPAGWSESTRLCESCLPRLLPCALTSNAAQSCSICKTHVDDPTWQGLRLWKQQNTASTSNPASSTYAPLAPKHALYLVTCRKCLCLLTFGIGLPGKHRRNNNSICSCLTFIGHYTQKVHGYDYHLDCCVLL